MSMTPFGFSNSIIQPLPGLHIFTPVPGCLETPRCGDFPLKLRRFEVVPTWFYTVETDALYFVLKQPVPELQIVAMVRECDNASFCMDITIFWPLHENSLKRRNWCVNWKRISVDLSVLCCSRKCLLTEMSRLGLTLWLNTCTHIQPIWLARDFIYSFLVWKQLIRRPSPPEYGKSGGDNSTFANYQHRFVNAYYM